MVCSHSQEIGPGFAARGLLSLAAEPQLAENSHQGSERNKSGRCIQKSAASATMNYLYDGADIVQELDIAGMILARYAQGLGIDRVLAEFRSGVTSYYQADDLGSITSLTNPSATTSATYSYDTFGNLSASTGSLTNPFRYTGRELDTETGLYFYRARYYDPNVGRFAREDPIRFEAGTNFYTYVANDPVDFADPSGLKSFSCKKYLNALGGEGARTGPDVPGNPLYHEYLCVQRGGQTVCGGQDHSGSAIWPGSPGIPSNDSMERGKCEQIEPDNDCFEKCELKKFKEPRPWYAIGPWGTDCQEWHDDVVEQCRKECRKKK